MLIHFWGVRGSIPTPVTAEQIQTKILSVVERITSKDLESADSKMKFIASLPEWIYGTVGGNSPCVEVVTKTGEHIILDGGSGLRVLAKNSVKPRDNHYYMLFSHFHWDHIQGIPFFDPAFNPNCVFDIYSNFPDMEEYLRSQSSTPYFPENAGWDKLAAKFNFHLLEEGKGVEIGGVKINTHKMKHPGDSYSISIEEDGKKFIYATDIELKNSDFDTSLKSNEFFRNADVMVLDSQYTADDAIRKENWGHSSFCFSIDFADVWKAKSVYLFHHEPTYDDKKLYDIFDLAKWYINYKNNCNIDLHIAIEGQEIKL